MTKYLLVDTSNMFFRARHIASKKSDSWDKVGLSLHLMFMSVYKCNRLFGTDHVIFALEGRSWRKDYKKTYKQDREIARAARTDEEVEEDKMYWEAYESLTTFLHEKTNCSVIQIPFGEADDVIARWIKTHPEDEHVIASSDSDFYQLIASNVKQYNGITDEIITLDGFFEAEKMKPVQIITDKKTGTKGPKLLEDPEWILFLKCMRGDPTDNIMSAYPGVRKKSTKKSIGLEDAYADRNKRGFNWNSIMLSRWVDHEGEEHRVLDRYELNRTLIDLCAQPDDIREAIDTYLTSFEPKAVPMVGAQFMKFCSKWDLQKIQAHETVIADILNKKLPK